jgi:hypothetical protein
MEFKFIFDDGVVELASPLKLTLPLVVNEE